MPRKQHESQRRLGQFTPLFRKIWSDPVFVKELHYGAQLIYLHLLSFDGISAAGVVRADAEMLSEKHIGMSAEEVERHLDALVEKKFIARTGVEYFMRGWFTTQPAQLRARNNVSAMFTAINRIGYDRLRAVVATEFFETLLEIEDLDREPTGVEIKKVCTEMAAQHQLEMPSRLNGTRK